MNNSTPTHRLRPATAFLALLLAVSCGLAALALTPSGAHAATPPEFLTQFGENCSAGGETSAGVCSAPCNANSGECGAAGETAQPRGIATDPKTGHVYVVDQSNQRVAEFTPWGGFVRAFGWDVAPGAVDEEQEVRVRAAAGQFKLKFSGESTTDLPFNADAAAVEAALNSLGSIGSGGVSVKEVKGIADGTTPFVYLIEFDGASLQASDVEQIVAGGGSTPLSGGDPATNLEARTVANGTVASVGQETCTVASGCKAGSQGAGTGQLSSPTGVALDLNGDVYVVDRENLRVEKFDQAGEFLWMVGGEVNQGPIHPGANLCTATNIEEGDSCGVGTAGTAIGQFSASWRVSSYVAVGPGDTVYVGDKERIQKFEADGTALAPIALPAPFDEGTVSSLAVVSAGINAGRIFVSILDPETATESIQPDERLVMELSATGTPICTIEDVAPRTLAADQDGNVYLYADRTNYSSDVSELRQYDPACQEVSRFAHHDFNVSTGVAVNSIGDVYASNFSGGGVDSYVRVYGPAPIGFESPPPVAPQIDAQYAAAVGTDAATLRARVNPHFWPGATTYLEYGSEECAKGGCTATAPVELTDKAIDDSLATAPVELSGLAPNTTYHYRFVAQSGGGGPVQGPDRSFRTYPLAAAGLPDSRAYEMVSPPNKGGGEVATPTAAGGGALFTVQPQQASASGDAITYASAISFGADPESAPASSQYLSTRGSGGWATDNINTRFEEGYLREPFLGFSADLRRAVTYAIEPELTADAALDVANLYLRDNLSGALTALTTEANHPQISPSMKPYEYCLYFGGASDDYGRIFFAAKGGLLPGDSVGDGFNLYEWSVGGGLRLVSVLPDGTNAKAAENTTFGPLGDSNQTKRCSPEFLLMRHAISAAGSRAFWTYEGTYKSAPNPLFARLDGAETIQLDKPNTGVAGKGGSGRYWDAATDGSRVFFTAPNRLTSAATAAADSKPDLYVYDFDRPEGERLTDLTPLTGEAASVTEVLGASADGSHAYFVARGVLSGAEENANGESAKAGTANLYAWHEGDGIRFLAHANPNFTTARLSPDGTHLAFLTTSQLSGFDNTVADEPGCVVADVGFIGSPACPEAYLYDYADDTLACASCNAAGARPLGPAYFPGWSTPYIQPRYLSDDGNRLFFETFDALDPRDTNRKRDVYEFERAGTGSCTAADPRYKPVSQGCQYLISSGQSGDESYFLDASTSGGDAFVSTRENIAYNDLDGRYDVYDARVGGTEPVPPPIPCQGEACRGPVSEAGSSPNPGTHSFEGPEPPAAKRCPKGKVRRGNRCVKKHVKHKHHKRKSHRHRTNNSEQGGRR